MTYHLKYTALAVALTGTIAAGCGAVSDGRVEAVAPIKPRDASAEADASVKSHPMQPGGQGGASPPASGGLDGGDWVACPADVDVVFVMDVSGSMGPFFDKIEKEIFTVDERLRKLKLAGEPHYGLVAFVDDTEILDKGKPATDAMTISDGFQWARKLAGLAQIHAMEFNGTFVENSLDAIYLGVTGFAWRPAKTTHRMIIHVTDDTFWDGPSEKPGVCDDFAIGITCDVKGSTHSYEEVVKAARDEKVWLSAFAAKARWFTGGVVDTQPGFFGPYNGHPSLPESTGGSAWDIADVNQGNVSLADTITDAVAETKCKVYPPVIF
jgi:hypothetical protein